MRSVPAFNLQAAFLLGLLARDMATMPDCCLVIEDRPGGIDAAFAAGMTSIGFCGGSHCGPEHLALLQARGAALVIANMRELAAAMATLNLSVTAPTLFQEKSPKENRPGRPK
jgi:beta-phosphoglucomutase-like phosphatase (HAD superfamily)